jgi:hypothetical protein
VYTSLRFGIICALIGAGTGSATGLVAGRSFGAWVGRSVAPIFLARSHPSSPAPPSTESPPSAPPDDSVRWAPGSRPPDHDDPSAPAAPLATPQPSASSSDCAQSEAAPEAFHAFDRARTTIDHGVSRGWWSPGDRDSIRKDLMLLPIETRNEIEKPLVTAVRDGRVHFHGRGPLF